jgi:PTS system ascorbate-specific IIC component
MIAVIMSVTNMSTVLMILVGGLALGLANTIFPAIAQPFTKQITKNDTVAMGHTGSFGYALSGLIGKYVGNKEKSTEDIKFPKGLAFLRDSTVSITLTMGIVYIIVALFAGSAFITENLSGGTNYIIYALQQAGMFAAGVTVILTGVRLILAEIVPAFKGISEKLVPNSIPALDCPIVFPYAPNAVLIGFLTSFLGGIVSLFIMVFTGTTVIIPGVVPHFFCGATAGVYGNATGGIRGAVVGSFIHGIIISFMPLLLMPVLGEMGFQGSTFSDTDYGAVGIFLGNMANWGGQVLVIGAVLSVFAILVLLTIFDKNKEKKAA